MRKLFNKADRIGDQNARPGFRMHGSYGGVECGEELVGNQHLTAGECPHQ